MPRGDGTGPAGVGPMSGRAAGFCAGYQTPGFANRSAGFGGGFGRGRGFFGRPRLGLGRRWGAWDGGYAAPQMAPPMQTGDEMQALKDHAAALRNQLDAVEKRLDEIAKEPQSE